VATENNISRLWRVGRENDALLTHSLTYTMEVGIESHKQEEGREVRRSLKAYGIEEGERLFHYALRSETLRLKGKIDLVIITTCWSAPDREAVIVEYKHSEQKAGAHFKLQLAAYALLLEEVLGIPVRRAFLYSIPLRKAEAIAITSALRKKVKEVLQRIRQMVMSQTAYSYEMYLSEVSEVSIRLRILQDMSRCTCILQFCGFRGIDPLDLFLSCSSKSLISRGFPSLLPLPG
jgi:CRISPR-associated exonuclease Cas4